jgi:hypothetical protein
MVRLGERCPGYGFERHKGYGTPEHMAAIAELGPTPEQHRRSFTTDSNTAVPPRQGKPRRVSVRDLPAAELWAYLLETPTCRSAATPAGTSCRDRCRSASGRCSWTIARPPKG